MHDDTLILQAFFVFLVYRTGNCIFSHTFRACIKLALRGGICSVQVRYFEIDHRNRRPVLQLPHDKAVVLSILGAGVPRAIYLNCFNACIKVRGQCETRDS